jgi:hypothetical protein
MKRSLTTSGILFLVVGLFYDALPVELLRVLWQMFHSDSRSVYFRVVPSEHFDLFQISFLLVGVALILAGTLARSTKSSS